MGLYVALNCQCDACGAKWEVVAEQYISDKSQNGLPVIVAKNMFRREYVDCVLCDMCAAPLNHKLKEIMERRGAG